MPNNNAVTGIVTSRSNANGLHISWREHIIDDEEIGGVPLRGGDGLTFADLDGDRREDIVSVYEADEEYDGVADGHIRIAFSSDYPQRWHRTTLAAGAEAGAAEDVAAGDINGDGHPDIVAACELAHLIYFQNPGNDVRTRAWQRKIPALTLERGSFIRVFLQDLNGDTRPEIIAVNKGAQLPGKARDRIFPISIFEITGDPLRDESWREHVLARIPWPINAQPVDINGDNRVDIVGGSVTEGRIFWFENQSTTGKWDFSEHRIKLKPVDSPVTSVPPLVNGFNMAFRDISGDGRVDILTFDTERMLGRNAVWLEQPTDPGAAWNLHHIGDITPDLLVGLVAADIDGDGDDDLMTGGYSLGSRTKDREVDRDKPSGRLAWFENRLSEAKGWQRHDISRRRRGMFDSFVVRDMDADGDIDIIGTRGNSGSYDGLFWLEQLRTVRAAPAFIQARVVDSTELPIPPAENNEHQDSLEKNPPIQPGELDP